MGLIESVGAVKFRDMKRAITGVPWKPWDNFFTGGTFGMGGPAHPAMSMYGLDDALGLPALYAGSKILADSAATLPLHVYQKPRTSGGRLIPYDGPTIFDDPSVLGTSFDWIFTCVASLILQGNAWGLITGKDGYGFPTGVEWIPCEHVYVQPDEQQPMNPMRTQVFAYGREMKWYGPDKELFQIKAFSLPGRVEGLSPLRLFALTWLAGKEAQRYGTSWYESGGFPPGTFQNSEIEIDPAQSAAIRQMLVQSLRRREPLVYGRDWDYTPVTVPPSEAQFIDAMQLNATHVAAILNLPAVRLGGTTGNSLTYSTTEANQLQIIEALTPWLVRMEKAFSNILPLRRTVRFNVDALLRTDLKTRTDIYQVQRRIGLRTIDELRELENLPPLEGAAGNESLPLDLMISMAQRAGALPKSMLDQVVLLLDVAGKKLEDLQKKGITKKPLDQEFTVDPKTGEPVGPANDPGAFYANMLNSFSRSMEDAGYREQAAKLRHVVSEWQQHEEPYQAYSRNWVPNKGVKELVDALDR